MCGDCGAFAYVNEEVPPYTVDEIVEFYADGHHTCCSVDHIIFDFRTLNSTLRLMIAKQGGAEITLSNAAIHNNPAIVLAITLLQLVSSMVGHRRQWPRQLNWSKWDMITLQ